MSSTSMHTKTLADTDSHGFLDEPNLTTESLPSHTSSLHALVIGIDAYPYTRPLFGCVADAERAAAYLQNDLGVPSTQIEVIRNEKATRACMIAKLRALAEDKSINKGDPIVIFYAGHGGETDSPVGWEAGDSKIQFLVPYDYCASEKWGPVMHGIPDRTIGALLEDLANKKGDNITVIFDSCNSGSGTRDDEHKTRRIRSIPKEHQMQLPADLDKHIWGGKRATMIPAGFLHYGLQSHVLLAACSAKQGADDSSEGGVFSLELFRTLRSIGADKLTYRDVLYRMSPLPNQDPQCEGIHQDRILFNGKAPSRGRLLYNVSQEGDVYTLSAGSAHGISAEAQFTVYANREAFGVASPLGKLVVSTVDVVESKLKILPNTAVFTLAEPGVALQTLSGIDEDLRLHIDGALEGVFKTLLGNLQRKDPKGRRVSLVDKDKADFDVTLENSKAVFHILNPLVQRYGVSRIPYPISLEDDDAYLKLRGIADFNWHLKRVCKTPFSRNGELFRDQISVAYYRLEQGSGLGEDYRPEMVPVGSDLITHGVIDLAIEEGTMYGLKITNNTGLSLFPSVFLFDTNDLSIKSYYEPPDAGNGRLDPPLLPHQSLTIGYGASGYPPFKYSLKDGNDVEVLFLKLFFATTDLKLSDLEQPSPLEGANRSGKRVELKQTLLWDSNLVQIVLRRNATA